MSGGDSISPDIREILAEWVEATRKRDAGAFADLFTQEPQPVVHWGSGETSVGWSAVRDHVRRDFDDPEIAVTKIEIFELRETPVSEEVRVLTFRYELTVKNLWGVEYVLDRLSTLVLRRGPFGAWKIATAHFSNAKEE